MLFWKCEAQIVMRDVQRNKEENLMVIKKEERILNTELGKKPTFSILGTDFVHLPV